MAERHAKICPQYEWGRVAVLLTVVFVVQSLSPVVVSEASFDEMTICQDSPGLGGECDSRMDADDGTTDITNWVEGMFNFNMTSPTEIQFQASWAIREWDKGGLDLFTSGDMALALSSDNIDSNDGLPADVLRSAFDENTDPDDAASPTIQESLLQEIDSTIGDFLANWGSSSTPTTAWVTDRIFLPDDSGAMSGVDCMLDPETDSDGNAFEPPVCISTDVVITLPMKETYGLESDEVTDSDLDTALEGLLLMGSQITTKFDVKVQLGHKGTYSIQPPDYATVINAAGTVGSLVEQEGGAYSSGLWSVDNRNDQFNLAPNDLSADLDMTMAYREGSTSVVDVGPNDKSMDLKVSVDLSDESNASIEVVAGIYQIQTSTLDSWGVDRLLPADKAQIPVITSDGLRMAYHTGLLELSELSKNIPLDGIGQALASSKGGLTVKMSDFQWVHVSSAPLDEGGLNYTHGSDCSRGVHYCMEGEAAMDDAYPVYMRSISNVIPLSLADLLGGNLGDAGFMNSVSGDDLGKLLNSGLEFSTVLSDDAMESFVGSLLPNGVSADLSMEIVLPEWVSTPDGGDSIVLNYRASGNHNGEISLTGSDSFYWNHAICKDTVPSACFDGGGDTVCLSTSKSCAYLDVDLDLGDVNFASLPLTKGVTVEFGLSVDLIVHRIAVPDSMFDSLNTETTSVSLDVLPSDLLRALLDIGSRGDPLEIEFSICEGKGYCDQKMPISSNESSGLPAYVNTLERDIKFLIDDKAREMTEEEGNGFGKLDMTGFSVDIEFPHEMITDNDDSIGDERGIVLSVDIPKVRINAGVDNSWGELIGILRGNGEAPEFGLVTEEVNTLMAPFVTPMVSAMTGLTNALSTSMVSADGVRAESSTLSNAPIVVPTGTLTNVGPDNLGLSFASSMTVTMPLGIVLENLTSSETGSITSHMNNDSRQVITYTITQGMSDDQIEFTLLLTPMWVISQVQFYIMGLLAFIIWRAQRRMTKRRRKRRARALEAMEEMAASPIGYIPQQPTVEVLQVTDNGIVIKRRLVTT